MSGNKGSQKSIKISEKLHKFLVDRGTKSDSFEDVIWRLIGQKEISQEDVKSLPPEYAPKLNEGKRKR